MSQSQTTTPVRARNAVKRSAALVAIVAASALTLSAQQQQQQPPPPARGDNRPLLGRVSPPQPQQKQGAEYFVGSWTYSWTGRESQITAGPRSGTVTFTAGTNPAVLTIAAEGTSEGAGPFKETGTLTWDDAKKSIALRERLAAGVDVTGTGDWSSPIGIRYESEPIRFQGKTLRLKRLYSIHNASSFSVTEEISTDGGPYARLGNGNFLKK